MPIPPLRETPKPKRCSNSNPVNHTYDDIGKFYVIPEEQKNQLFAAGGISKPFEIQIRAFAEMAIMIRKPALEIMENIKMSNFSKPAVRYLLYGKSGSGKSVTINHLLHFGKSSNFVTLHVPWVPNWIKWWKKEACMSERRQGLVDVPLEAALILKHFQIQNSDFLKDENVTIAHDYIWNQRETTAAGSPLSVLIAHGINRVKYACDCVDGLVKELKILATNGKCKLLIVIDGFNAFYNEKTLLKVEDKSIVTAERVSMVQTMLEAVKPDWSNGAIILSISPRATFADRRESPMPLYLLKKKGFEAIDPFIPVEVPELSEQEFHNLLDYYEDRRWIHKLGGREEIQFLTSRIVGEISKFCSPL